jgi:hypothetical protein
MKCNSEQNVKHTNVLPRIIALMLVVKWALVFTVQKLPSRPDVCDHDRFCVSAERILQKTRQLGVAVGHVGIFCVNLKWKINQGSYKKLPRKTGNKSWYRLDWQNKLVYWKETSTEFQFFVKAHIQTSN